MFYLYNKITSLSTKSQDGNEKRDSKENVTNCLDDQIDKNKNDEECYKKDEDIFLMFEDTNFENSDSGNKNVNTQIKLSNNQINKIENKLKVDLNKQNKSRCVSEKEDIAKFGELYENGDNDDNFFKINQNNFCNFEFPNYNDNNNHEDNKENLKNTFPKLESNSSIDWSNINLKNNTKRYLSENIDNEFQNFNFENEDFDNCRAKDNEEVTSECNIKNVNNDKNEKIIKENSDFFFAEASWDKCINENGKWKDWTHKEDILKAKQVENIKVNEETEINVSIKEKSSDEIISSILKKNGLHENSFKFMESNDMTYKKTNEKEIKEDPFTFKFESSFNDKNICEEIESDYKKDDNSFSKNTMHNDMQLDLIKNNFEVVSDENFSNNSNDNNLPDLANEMEVKKDAESFENSSVEHNNAEQSAIVEDFQENKNVSPKKMDEIEEIKVSCNEREDDVVSMGAMEECVENNDKNECNSFDNFFYESQTYEAEEISEKGNVESFLFEKNMSFIDDEFEEICECDTSVVENIKPFQYEKISTNLLIKNNDNVIQSSLEKEEEDKNEGMVFEEAKMGEDNKLLSNESSVNPLSDEINTNSNKGENSEILEEKELWVDNTFIKETRCDSISENGVKECESDEVLNENKEVFEKEDNEKILCDKEKFDENELWNEERQIKFSECKNNNSPIVIMNNEEEKENENILCENKTLWGEKKIMNSLTREDSIGIYTAKQGEENIIFKNKEIEIEKCSEKNEVKIDIENGSQKVISLENKKNNEMNEDKKKKKSNNSKFDNISKENIHSKNNNLTSVNLSRFTYEKINEIKANNRKEKKSVPHDNEKKTDTYDNISNDINCNNMKSTNKLCNLKFNKINEVEENTNYCQDIDKRSYENNNFIRENEIKVDLNNNDNKKCNIISMKETTLKKKNKKNDGVENNIDGNLVSITKKFEYESNSLNFLKALKDLPDLKFLKCKDLNPFLRHFNIVLKAVNICFNNEIFFYVLAGDETGCAYVKLRNEFRDLFKGNDTFIIENCSVMEEGFHIILEMNKYSNIYPLKYNTIKNINKYINFSDAKFVSLSEHII
ncbi:conserved Plasmodium protein, unknown function [Plasmodium vinckei brucechwatti]|uniref:Uncharacterized protein n=1 Tax=Plasmodium vinckei brucechwatti TaxID=119398 RepID=A0A6V7RWA9_PLAVN|nr:conserved Plasmodium protein, unknown function [Plasmodium vinckei brucechwatti]